MKYLLDVNVLVAWGWQDHVEHDRVTLWLRDLKQDDGVVLLTSPIPQLGFVRVSVQRSAGTLTVKEATETLAGMLASLRSQHVFVADDIPAERFPEWCSGASRTTDAHLVLLAAKQCAQVATLDSSIPGAFVVPE